MRSNLNLIQFMVVAERVKQNRISGMDNVGRHW